MIFISEINSQLCLIKYYLYLILILVCAYFKSLGADFVFDLKIPEDISLMEQTKEFVEQYQNKRSTEASTKSGKHTILTSACPGWICYAEKTHGSWILPYISRVKSGQQIMGSIVKQHLSKTLRVSSSDIIHVTVMPCFDKKLEGKKYEGPLSHYSLPYL